jgi:hypothetical protein
MKDLSSTIGQHIVPMYGIEHTLHQATLPVSRQVEASTWDEIDRTVSELYYDIREVTTEQLEGNHNRAR